MQPLEVQAVGDAWALGQEGRTPPPPATRPWFSSLLRLFRSFSPTTLFCSFLLILNLNNDGGLGIIKL